MHIGPRLAKTHNNQAELRKSNDKKLAHIRHNMNRKTRPQNKYLHSSNEFIDRVQQIHNPNMRIYLVRIAMSLLSIINTGPIDPMSTRPGFWNSIFYQFEQSSHRLPVIKSTVPFKLSVQRAISLKIIKVLVWSGGIHKVDKYPVFKADVAEGHINASHLSHI